MSALALTWKVVEETLIAPDPDVFYPHGLNAFTAAVNRFSRMVAQYGGLALTRTTPVLTSAHVTAATAGLYQKARSFLFVFRIRSSF